MRYVVLLLTYERWWGQGDVDNQPLHDASSLSSFTPTRLRSSADGQKPSVVIFERNGSPHVNLSSFLGGGGARQDRAPAYHRRVCRSKGGGLVVPCLALLCSFPMQQLVIVGLCMGTLWSHWNVRIPSMRWKVASAAWSS